MDIVNIPIKLVGTRMVDNQSTPAHRPHILHSRVDWLYRPYVLDYIFYWTEDIICCDLGISLLWMTIHWHRNIYPWKYIRQTLISIVPRRRRAPGLIFSNLPQRPWGCPSGDPLPPQTWTTGPRLPKSCWRRPGRDSSWQMGLADSFLQAIPECFVFNYRT